MKNRKGFTILELLVVVAIIAILAVIAVPQFMGAIEKSRVSAQIADVNAVAKAATMYNFDNSKYPAEATAVADLTQGATTYVNAMPAANKWNGAFTYKVLTTITDAKVNATGADGTDALDDATGARINSPYLLMTEVPNNQAKALDLAIDQADDKAAGMVQYAASSGAKAATHSDVTYFISK